MKFEDIRGKSKLSRIIPVSLYKKKYIDKIISVIVLWNI